MPRSDRPLPGDLTKPASWNIAELQIFNEDRAAYLAWVGEQCGAPRMNAFVHALDMVDELDIHLAVRAVTASELCRQMMTWAARRRDRILHRLNSQRPAPVAVHHRGIAGNRGAARQARTWLVAIMNEQDHGMTPWRVDIVADAALCMNELVIAALTTSSTALALSVAISADGLRMSVQGEYPDPADKFDPKMPSLRAQLMGFRIVNKLADDWGADVVTSVRELWAEFALRDANTPSGTKHDLACTAPDPRASAATAEW